MRSRRKGSAVVEAALMMPWLAFLFFGVLDFGFYSYAAICTQAAARAAAVATSAYSSQDPAIACAAALGELKGLVNMTGVTTCAALPAIVTVRTLAAPDCADCVADPAATSVQVAVTYQSIPLIPILGSLTNQLTLTRVAEMRILGP